MNYYLLILYEFDFCFKATLNWNFSTIVSSAVASPFPFIHHSPLSAHTRTHTTPNKVNVQFGVFFDTPLVMLLPSIAENLSVSIGIRCWSLPCNEWQNFFVLLQSSFSDKLNIENDGSPVTSLTMFKNFGKQLRSLSPSSDEYVSSSIKPLHLRNWEIHINCWQC